MKIRHATMGNITNILHEETIFSGRQVQHEGNGVVNVEGRRYKFSGYHVGNTYASSYSGMIVKPLFSEVVVAHLLCAGRPEEKLNSADIHAEVPDTSALFVASVERTTRPDNIELMKSAAKKFDVMLFG
jgi:hypothetical protein